MMASLFNFLQKKLWNSSVQLQIHVKVTSQQQGTSWLSPFFVYLAEIAQGHKIFIPALLTLSI